MIGLLSGWRMYLVMKRYSWNEWITRKRLNHVCVFNCILILYWMICIYTICSIKRKSPNSITIMKWLNENDKVNMWISYEMKIYICRETIIIHLIGLTQLPTLGHFDTLLKTRQRVLPTNFPEYHGRWSTARVSRSITHWSAVKINDGRICWR